MGPTAGDGRERGGQVDPGVSDSPATIPPRPNRPAAEHDDDLKSPKVRRIPTYEIDMSPPYREDDKETLVRHLKDLGLFSDQYGYCVIHPSLEDRVRSEGTYRFKRRDGTPKREIFLLEAGLDCYDEENLHQPGTEYDWRTYADHPEEDCANGMPIWYTI